MIYLTNREHRSEWNLKVLLNDIEINMMEGEFTKAREQEDIDEKKLGRFIFNRSYGISI